jgi:hypothetical protein
MGFQGTPQFPEKEIDTGISGIVDQSKPRGKITVKGKYAGPASERIANNLDKMPCAIRSTGYHQNRITEVPAEHAGNTGLLYRGTGSKEIKAVEKKGYTTPKHEGPVYEGAVSWWDEKKANAEEYAAKVNPSDPEQNLLVKKVPKKFIQDHKIGLSNAKIPAQTYMGFVAGQINRKLTPEAKEITGKWGEEHNVPEGLRPKEEIEITERPGAIRPWEGPQRLNIVEHLDIHGVERKPVNILYTTTKQEVSPMMGNLVIAQRYMGGVQGALVYDPKEKYVHWIGSNPQGQKGIGTTLVGELLEREQKVGLASTNNAKGFWKKMGAKTKPGHMSSTLEREDFEASQLSKSLKENPPTETGPLNPDVVYPNEPSVANPKFMEKNEPAKEQQIEGSVSSDSAAQYFINKQLVDVTVPGKLRSNIKVDEKRVPTEYYGWKAEHHVGAGAEGVTKFLLPINQFAKVETPEGIKRVKISPEESKQISKRRFQEFNQIQGDLNKEVFARAIIQPSGVSPSEAETKYIVDAMVLTKALAGRGRPLSIKFDKDYKIEAGLPKKNTGGDYRVSEGIPRITIYNSEMPNKQSARPTLIHEIGHHRTSEVIDTSDFEASKKRQEFLERWNRYAPHEKVPSEYGKKDIGEDIAESYALHVANRLEDPTRGALLSSFIGTPEQLKYKVLQASKINAQGYVGGKGATEHAEAIAPEEEPVKPVIRKVEIYNPNFSDEERAREEKRREQTPLALPYQRITDRPISVYDISPAIEQTFEQVPTTGGETVLPHTPKPLPPELISEPTEEELADLTITESPEPVYSMESPLERKIEKSKKEPEADSGEYAGDESEVDAEVDAEVESLFENKESE